MKHLVIITLFLLLVPNLSSFAGEKPVDAVNELQQDGKLQNWLILGPFPNEKTDKPTPPEHVTRQGFQTDYLKALGGESGAVISLKTTVDYQQPDGQAATAKSQTARPNERGYIDLQAAYPDAPQDVAYGYCTLQSKTEQTVHFFLGHDDGAKMWLNGELVHRVWPDGGHGFINRQYHFTGKLNAGDNRILVKVENWGYDWNFKLEALDSVSVQPILRDIEERRALTAFLNCHPRPEGRWDYMIAPGAFPKIVWNEPEAVAKFGGKMPLAVQWYNSKLEAVVQPGAPGRYVASVSGKTENGQNIRRMVTVYCRDPKWVPWYEENKMYPNYFNNSGFDRQSFMKYREMVAPMLGGFLQEKMAQEEIGAILYSFWQELRPDIELKAYETPDVLHNDFQVALKRKILGVSNETYPQIKAAQMLAKPARELHKGSTNDAGVTKDAEKKLRELCQEWADHSETPFNVLIARHGVIVLHDAFGGCSVDQKYSVASITKAVAGLTFARFVDQGLIDIDDPVGKYLPDFPTDGPKVVTARQLFTHTTGLDGHGDWGGLNNAWLDNVVALQLDKLAIGKIHKYNGMGYDLSGKLMELVAGKCIQRVVQEQLWLPLGIEGSSLYDLGFSAMLNAEDIAKMGQLLLNKGSYGDRQLFSPDTYEQIIPKNLSQYYPEVDVEWGIGLSYRRTEKIQGDKKSGYILTKNIIGHGSASKCIFLVDLEHDLVIAQARPTGGKDYDPYYRKLLATVESILRD